MKISKDTKFLYFLIAGNILFTILIFVLGRKLPEIAFAPDTGYSHYYWKLPEPSQIARITAWTGYILHQITSWTVLYFAQKNKKPFDNVLNKYNFLMLGVHAVFSILHLIQTQLWYDALAQDTSIMLSQGSVIGMLVLVLIMLNNRRGLLFGWKAPIPQKVVQLVSKYHGYYILWALVFTFWYHPMEPLSGHLIGFFYMFLLMAQSITLYTRVHINNLWMVILESTVLVHGTLVALMNRNGMWPMFFSGFGFLLIATQIYTFNRLNKVWRSVIQIGYFSVVIFIYLGGLNSGRGITRIHEITWIPIAEYGLVLIVSLLLFIPIFINKKLKKEK